MGLKKLTSKIADYNERFERGEASRIEPGHVENTLEKLRKKSDDLKQEISKASSVDKRERLEKKLEIARIQTDRAKWLLKELGG